MTRLLGTVALIGAAAAPGLALAPGYADPVPAAGLLAGWAVAAVLITAALHRRLTAPMALLAGLPVALAGIVALAAVLPGPQGEPWRDTIDAVVHSGARILTSALPTPMAVDTLALPALAIWLAGSAATLALRGGYPLTGVLCPLLALAGAAVLNGPEVRPAYFPAALFALAAVVLLAISVRGRQRSVAGDALRATPLDQGDRGERLISTLPQALSLGGIIALVAALTAYLGPLALYGSPFRPADPRESVTPPQENTDTVSPLSYLAQWAAEPHDPLLTVTAEEPTDLRWVTLGEFDGVTWLPVSRFQAAADLLPPPDATVLPGPMRTATIEAGDLPGYWLPAVGVPRRVEGVTVGFDPASTTLRIREGTVEGVEYTVTGQVPEWEDENLAEAEEPDPEEFERYLRIPDDPPPQLEEIAAEFGDGNPYERANRLAAHLRDNYGFDPETPGGHGYANLEDFLVSPGSTGEGGTSEQFASAFALLARAVDLPSRVVVGFAPGTPEDGDTYTVHTGDAIAWGEVYLEGVGWTPFDVTPGEPEEDEESGGSRGGAGEEAGDLGSGEEEEEDTGMFRTSGPPLDVSYAWALAGRVAVGMSAVLLLGALLVGTLRGLRRWLRLRARNPRRRALGAWWELRDGLRLAGAPPLPSDTVSEVLARANALLPAADGKPRSWTLGRTMNAMAFMPATPQGGSDSRVGMPAAERVADEVRAYTADLRARRSRFRRLLWWLDPRPLFWGRR